MKIFIALVAFVLNWSEIAKSEDWSCDKIDQRMTLDIAPFKHPFLSLSFSDDCRFLLGSSVPHFTYVAMYGYDFLTKEKFSLVLPQPYQDAGVRGSIVSKNGKYAASVQSRYAEIGYGADRGESIAVWNLSTKQLVFISGVAGTIAHGLAFSSDESILYAAVGNDVLAFDVETGRVIKTFMFGARVTTIAVSKDGKNLALGTAAGEVIACSLPRGNLCSGIKRQEPIEIVSIDNDRSEVVFRARNSPLGAADTITRTLKREYAIASKTVDFSLKLSGGRILRSYLLSEYSSQIQVIDSETASVLSDYSCDTHACTIYGSTLSSDGNVFAVSIESGAVEIELIADASK